MCNLLSEVSSCLEFLFAIPRTARLLVSVRPSSDECFRMSCFKFALQVGVKNKSLLPLDFAQSNESPG